MTSNRDNLKDDDWHMTQLEHASSIATVAAVQERRVPMVLPETKLIQMITALGQMIAGESFQNSFPEKLPTMTQYMGTKEFLMGQDEYGSLYGAAALSAGCMALFLVNAMFEEKELRTFVREFIKDAKALGKLDDLGVKSGLEIWLNLIMISESADDDTDDPDHTAKVEFLREKYKALDDLAEAKAKKGGHSHGH